MRSRRYYERQIDKLFAIIAEQNDRIMYLAGRTWGDPPAVQALDERQFSLNQAIDQTRYSFAPEQDPEDVEAY